MILRILTCIHLALSLMTIGAGLKVLFGLLAGRLYERWTLIFLRCAVAASMIRLLSPIHPFLLTHWFAMLTIYASAAVFLGWCKFRLAGIWRSICAFSIMIVLGLNILLVTTQVLMKFRH
jgi:hypothetical protein